MPGDHHTPQCSLGQLASAWRRGLEQVLSWGSQSVPSSWMTLCKWQQHLKAWGAAPEGPILGRTSSGLLFCLGNHSEDPVLHVPPRDRIQRLPLKPPRLEGPSPWLSYVLLLLISWGLRRAWQPQRHVVGAGLDRRLPFTNGGFKGQGSINDSSKATQQDPGSVSIGREAGFRSLRAGPGGCQGRAVLLGKVSASQCLERYLCEPANRGPGLYPEEVRSHGTTVLLGSPRRQILLTPNHHQEISQCPGWFGSVDRASACGLKGPSQVVLSTEPTVIPPPHPQ
ncbi:hypothetical protein QTO34_018925 [Cnephaeus nilssonii]|uniref:Uncharacterized protein n=1 Tax=Cnephaeus nilssonii TaxID=3371016 RepID=A0AA40HZP9_CNENI|nr:hypothetical protein QTO34_018925 [Eptesicus nilssonii]